MIKFLKNKQNNKIWKSIKFGQKIYWLLMRILLVGEFTQETKIQSVFYNCFFHKYFDAAMFEKNQESQVPVTTGGLGI